VLRVIFWGIVVLDVIGISLLFVFGLAAAGSTKGTPMQVALYLVVLPAIPLAASVFWFTRATSTGGRVLALLLAAAPLLVLGVARAIAEVQVRTTVNESGEMTFFRSGPKREMAEAIARNDARTVDSLLANVDVNDTGVQGMTFLVLAARQLSETPEQHEVLRLLLEAGANPNKSAQYDFPLDLAIQESGKAGLEPVKMLLDAGANPNQRNSFGQPIYFDAVGQSSTLETLTLLLDRGADINAVAKDGSTVLFDAANSRNWKGVLLLLRRGANWRLGRAVNGMPFDNWVDGSAGLESGDSAYMEVRRFLKLN
jgi:ankyrin repeat protein